MIKQIKLNRDFANFLKSTRINSISSGGEHNYIHTYYNYSIYTIFEYSESRNTLHIHENEMKFAFRNFDNSLIQLIRDYIDKPNIKTIIK